MNAAAVAALRSFLRPELVRADVAAEDAEGALTEISRLLALGQPGSRPAEILFGLRERERLGSTAIGGGCAIPHARLNRFESPVLVVARTARGVEFGASDGEPVRLFFGLGAPSSSPGSHLQILSAVARWLRGGDRRSALLDAPDAAAMVAVLAAG